MKNFRNNPKWYSQLCRDADLMIHGAVKGTMVLQSHGLKIWRLIQEKFDDKLKSLNFNEVAVSSLVALPLLKLEQNHLIGFSPELFYLNHCQGGNANKIVAALRPTSELLFCDLFQKTLSRYSQLPFLFYQWGTVFRAEKNTKPFLRNSEFWWLEGHCLHKSVSHSHLLLQQIHAFFIDFIAGTCLLNFLAGEKTNHEKFAGAITTHTVETILHDGQALQCATTHDLGFNFTKPFQIKYQTQQNTYDYPTQGSFGISSRIIGALVLVHSDEHGLLLPSQLNPNKIIIINRLGNHKSKNEIAGGSDIENEILTKILPYSAEIIHPLKFKEELLAVIRKGAALIIIITADLLTKNQVSVYIRVQNSKVTISQNQLGKFITVKIAEHDQILQQRANQLLQQKIVTIVNQKELQTAIFNKKVAKAYFFPNEENELIIKKETMATIRLIKQVKQSGICFFSKKNTKKVIYLSKSY